MEMESPISSSARKFYEGRRRAGRRRCRSIEISRQVNVLRRTTGGARANERCRQSRQHLCAVEREWLRAEECCARCIEHIHAHVIGVGPNSEVRIIEEVIAEVERGTVVRTRGIACRGN